MSPEDILAVLSSLLGAAPQILTLFQQAQTGTTVTPDQVNAALSQYATDRVTVLAQIAAEKSAGD
jgi:hypothetical protein